MQTLNTPVAASPEQDDNFLASIRIDQSYTGAAVGVKKPLLTVPVRKPVKTEFVRVHPVHMIDCHVVELKAEREVYVLTPGLELVLAEFVEGIRLRLCVSRQGVAFLWPIKLPRDDMRGEAWRKSAAEAAGLGETNWVRVAADMNLGAYQPYVATGELGEPRWPEEPWPQILKIALRDRLIEGVEHAVVRQLLGQV